jgi:hypothetical protein
VLRAQIILAAAEGQQTEHLWSTVGRSVFLAE